MLPQSFGHVNQKGMPAYFKEMLSKDKDEQIRLANDMVNEMGKTPEERHPDTQRRIEDMMQAVKDVKLTPPSQLSPQLQEVQRFMLTTESQRVQGDDKTGLPALLEEERQQHKKMIDCALMTCPPLRDLQHQINALLLNDSEERSFDIPAFREALHKHFARNKEFLMIDAFTLTETCLLCQLIDLHMRKPETGVASKGV